MGEQTKIEWATHTFNSWIGCAKVSDGCKNCYASVGTFARIHRSNGRELWGKDAVRHITSDANWRKPLAWNEAAQEAGERRIVFAHSLSDVFEDRADLIAPRRRLAKLISATAWLDWLLVTKRPEYASGHIYEMWFEDGEWPLNYWLGTSVENQATADARIPYLVRTLAPLRFLSVEPLLGPIDLDLKGIDWVIVGGESGPNARPCNTMWIRSIVKQCHDAGVAVFVKQLGSWPTWDRDDTEHFLRDKKGGNMAEWPSDLQVREFPKTAGVAA